MSANQRGVFEGTDPEGNINTVLNQIQLLVAEYHIYSHLRVLIAIVGNQARKHGGTEQHWRSDTKSPRRRALHACDRNVGFLDFPQDACALVVVGITCVSKAETPRCALNQTYTEAFFELSDLSADCRLGQTQMARSTSETARFHNMNEDSHFVKIELFAFTYLHAVVFP